MDDVTRSVTEGVPPRKPCLPRPCLARAKTAATHFASPGSLGEDQRAKALHSLSKPLLYSRGSSRKLTPEGFDSRGLSSLEEDIPETDCPLTPVTHCSSRGGPVEVALHNMRETRVFDGSQFKDATLEAYYGVHRLHGGVLFRAVEMACQDETYMAILEEVWAICESADTDDVAAACWATYDHYGTNTIHLMHFAASLGSVPVMGRLVAYLGDEVINIHGTIVRDRDMSRKVDHHGLMKSVSFLPSATRSFDFSSSSSSLTSSLRRSGSTSSHARHHYTPLLSALYMSRVDAVIWLLDNKADPNLPNIDGHTAIHMLAKSGLPYESVWKQDEAADKLTMKLVECRADMDTLTKFCDHLPKWQCGKTALQLAASKMSSYPKHMLYLLAKSYQTPEKSEPLKELTLIAQVNPTAAESLVEAVRWNRMARKRLVLEVHMRADRDPLDDLVEVIRTAAPVAADILEMLTFRPQVKSLQKNPLPPYAWLKNRQMVCTYKPDVSEGIPTHMLENTSAMVGQISMPIWDYADPEIPWHRKFKQATEYDLQEDSRVYKVEVKVLHLPNILNFCVPHALCSLSEEPRQLEIFGRIPVQAIVECLWESVRAAHWLNLVVEVLVLIMILLIGYIPATEAFHPSSSILGSVIVGKVIFDFVNMASFVYSRYGRKKLSWWKPFCSAGGLSELACYILLVALAIHANDGDEPAGETILCQGRWKVLIAMNIFMRFLCLLRLCRSLRGFGETVISVQKSIPKIWNMLLLMTLVLVAFACIFLTLKDKDRSTQFILINMWLAMILAEGDGVEGISGFDTDHKTYTGEGSPVVIEASIIFMMIATVFFCVVLMNLMIAIYSNYYEEMVPMAPFHFQKMRAKDCACYMLRPRWPTCFESVWKLNCFCRCSYAATALLFLLWLWLERRTSWGPCLGMLLALVLIQLQATFLVDKWQAGPEDQRHYLWVCYRADLYEIAGGASAAWQRHVRGELTALQRGQEELKTQISNLTRAITALPGDEIAGSPPWAITRTRSLPPRPSELE